MIFLIVRFLNIFIVGLVAGTLFGIWIGYNPLNLSDQTYVEQQQGVIIALNTLMPILGLSTIILTLISAFMLKDNKTVFIILVVAAVLLIISGLVTRFGNQPINSTVMTWNKLDPPNDWYELRNKWWSWHIVRTISALLAFCLIVWASLRRI
ncbi:MAG: DUF1772 domain-containing protein [Aquaticitalea sp.]